MEDTLEEVSQLKNYLTDGTIPEERNLNLIMGIQRGCMFCLALVLVSGTVFADGYSPQSDETMRSLVESELAKSTILFEGKVERFEVRHAPGTPTPKGSLGMKAWDGEFVVIIRASRVYRGPAQDTVEVRTGMNLVEMESSDFIFDTEKAYLVDASQDPSGHFRVFSSSATRLLEQAGPELRFLRGEEPTSDDLLSPAEYYKKWPVPLPQWAGKICGHVFRKDGKPVSRDVRITAWRLRDPLLPEGFGDADINSYIEVDGAFCLDSLTSGSYVVGAEYRDEEAGEEYTKNTHYVGYHPGAFHASKAVAIELKDGQTISNAKIVLYPEHLNSLRGKIVTSDGSALPSKYLTVGIESTDGELLHPEGEVGAPKVSEDGFFEFKSLAPGTYSVFAFFDSNGPPKPAKIWKTAEADVTIKGETNDFVLTIAPADRADISQSVAKQ